MVLPEIPGISLNPAYEREKIRHVANLMKVKHNRYILLLFLLYLIFK